MQARRCGRCSRADPLARVFVTRPEPGASRTAERLCELGHDVIVAPLFHVHSVQWMPPGEMFDAIMLTSANAVRLAGPLPARLRALPCYAVGRATAAAAERRGFTQVRAGDGDAEALAALMTAEGVVTALHLAGREHRAITADGPRIITRVVYAAEPVERLDAQAAAALGAGVVDAVLLYSARAARTFAGLVDDAQLRRNRLCLGALSPAVAQAAGPGWKAVAIADTPDEARLFAACGLLCENG